MLLYSKLAKFLLMKLLKSYKMVNLKNTVRNYLITLTALTSLALTSNEANADSLYLQDRIPVNLALGKTPEVWDNLDWNLLKREERRIDLELYDTYGRFSHMWDDSGISYGFVGSLKNVEQYHQDKIFTPFLVGRLELGSLYSDVGVDLGLSLGAPKIGGRIGLGLNLEEK